MLAGFRWCRGTAAAFAAGLVIGAIVMYFAGPKQQAVVREVAGEPVRVQTVMETKKEMVYVEKEAGEATDVQVSAASPQVTVDVNGKVYKFDVLKGEEHKFDKGKLVITEETRLKLDIKTPTPPRYSLGVGWGTHGPALSMTGRVGSGAAGWWLYGDKRTAAAGVQIGIGQ